MVIPVVTLWTLYRVPVLNSPVPTRTVHTNQCDHYARQLESARQCSPICSPMGCLPANWRAQNLVKYCQISHFKNEFKCLRSGNFAGGTLWYLLLFSESLSEHLKPFFQNFLTSGKLYMIFLGTKKFRIFTMLRIILRAFENLCFPKISA